MRTPIFAAGILLLVTHFAGAVVSLQPSDTTRKNLSDTSHIYFGPNYHGSNVDRMYASTTVSDPTIFHLSSGVNVLNTLRGQAANLLMSNSAFGTNASLRTGTPLYVIDGVVSRNPETFYNLNAFEYQNISVINSGNAAARYGGGGLNSAFFLQRKTGANIEGPSFEFTSYTTYASNEVTNNYWDGTTEEKTQWMFTNGIAYAQDFGAVDTRVSYTYGRFPSVDDVYDGSSVHTTSINTGYEHGRFNARLILDQFARFNGNPTPHNYYDADAGNGSSQTERFFQGNLALNYQFSNWINLSSITVTNYLDDELSRAFRRFETAPLETEQYDQQRRVMNNVFLRGSTPSTKTFQIHYSIGYQIDKTSLDKTGNVIYRPPFVVELNQWETEDLTIKSLLAETGFSMNDKFNMTFNYQHNDFGSLTNNTYAVGFMLDLNKISHANSNELSTARFRGNYGQSDFLNNTVFPYGTESALFATNNILTEGKNIEGGFDLGFMNDRFNLHVTYFHNLGNSDFVYYELALPPMGLARHLVDLGKLTTKGWEIVADADVIQNQALRWNAKFTWGRINPVLEYFDYTNQTPDWRSGLLNQFHLNNWMFSFLIDSRFKGELYFDQVIGGVPVREGDEDLQMELRDISVAYTLVPKSKSTIDRVMLSLSARNMWTVYSSIGADSQTVENIYTAKKNISLSITAAF